MISLFIYLAQQQGFFGTLYARIQEGGPFQMSLIILLFLLMIFLIVRAGMKLKGFTSCFQKICFPCKSSGVTGIGNRIIQSANWTYPGI